MSSSTDNSSPPSRTPRSTESSDDNSGGALPSIPRWITWTVVPIVAVTGVIGGTFYLCTSHWKADFRRERELLKRDGRPFSVSSMQEAYRSRVQNRSDAVDWSMPPPLSSLRETIQGDLLRKLNDTENTPPKERKKAASQRQKIKQISLDSLPYIFASLYLPSYLRSYEFMNQIRVKLDLLRLAVTATVEAHETGTNLTPIPGINQSTDPFSGNPYQIKETETHVILYSRGKDLEDNGGALHSGDDRDPGIRIRKN